MTRTPRDELVSNCQFLYSTTYRGRRSRGPHSHNISFIQQQHSEGEENGFLPGQSVDSALHQNQPELGVFVLPVSLQMLPDGDGLLDQVVHVLGQLGGHALPLEDTQDLVAGDESHLEMLDIKYLDTNRRFEK